MERHIIGAIGDIDDTMIPWEVPHSRAYPAMSAALSRVSGLPEDQIISDIKQVNTKYGTIEYTALIQEMPSFQKLSPARQKKLVEVAIKSRRAAIEGLTTPFPDIDVLLHTLNYNGLIQVALSDAPVNLAYLRLKRERLLDYFDLVAGSPSPDDSLFAPEHRMGNKKYLVPVKTVETKKPFADLSKLLNLTPEQIRDRYFLYGNSEHSDQGEARRNGMLFYQTNWDRGTQEMRDILLKYAPERVLAGNVGTKAADGIETHPDFEMVKVNSAMEMIEDLQRRRIIKELPPALTSGLPRRYNRPPPPF